MQNNKILNDYTALIGQLNKETRKHCYNVASMCQSIASHMGLNAEIAYKVGLLHDVGKVYIPSRILKKNRGLTDIEREIIDLHSYYGYKILKNINEPPEVYIPVLFHHGIGKTKLCVIDEPLTPEMLEMIYIVHSVDIFEAMASKRTYHEPVKEDIIYDVLSRDFFCTEQIIEAIKKFNESGSL